MAFIYCIAIVGLAVAGMGYCRSVLEFCTLNIFCGLAIPFCDVPLNTYIQMEVEDALRGRVNSVINMIRMGVMPVGTLLGGKLVEMAGLTATFVIMGGGLIFAALIGLCSSDFRKSEIREQIGTILSESSLKLASD
jgi:MFS family permease